MQSRSSRLAASAALLLVVLLGFSSVPQQAYAASGLIGLVSMQMKDYITYSSGAMSASGTTVTFASSLTKCLNGGGVPASITNTALNSRLVFEVSKSGGTSNSVFFAGASAEPSSANPNKCVNNVQSASQSPNSLNCYYRWIYGYFSVYSYNGEIGTAFWSGLYPTSNTAAQELNMFGQYYWNPSNDRNGVAFPRGKYYGVAIPNAAMSRLFGMDSSGQWASGDLSAQSNYMVACEVQLYPAFPSTTTRMPQPSFVNGFRTLTWSEEHWYVIFIIFTVIILGILFAIITYCCWTSRKPAEQPPLFQMVLRERVGKAYVVKTGGR